MDQSAKEQIAKSFPGTFEQAALGIELSFDEFALFERGIFASSMDEKWHAFIVNNMLHLVRSWTDICIYRIFPERKDETILLTKFHVNRDKEQYGSTDLERDTVLLKQVLGWLIQKEFYSPPELEFPLIKQIIEKDDVRKECKKQIGRLDVATIRLIYQGMTEPEQRQFIHVKGWEELEERIALRPDEAILISLHLGKKNSQTSITYYFDDEAKELLGQIETIIDSEMLKRAGSSSL